MKLSRDTTILTLVQEYPFLIEALAERNPIFGKLKSPVLRNTLGRVATVAEAAAMGKENSLELLLFIAGRIMAATGDPVEITPPEVKKTGWFITAPVVWAAPGRPQGNDQRAP